MSNYSNEARKLSEESGSRSEVNFVNCGFWVS